MSDSTDTLIVIAALFVGGILLTKAQTTSSSGTPTIGTTGPTKPGGSCKIAAWMPNAGAICEWQAAREAKGEDAINWAACWDHLKRLGLVGSFAQEPPAGFADYYK